MNVNRKKLLEILTLVKPGVAAKELVEQSGSFAFVGGRVYTYNDEVSVSHPIDFHVEGAVSATELFSLLSKCKEDEIFIEEAEEGLLIKGKKFNATIRFQTSISLPVNEIQPKGNWKSLPKSFKEAVKFCIFSAGKDMTQPALTCLHAKGDIIESCDRFRLTRYFFDSAHFDEPILIPSGAAKELHAYDVIEYVVENGWIHFATEEDTVFSCRTYGGLKYPDLDVFLNVKGAQLKFPTDMKEILDKATIFNQKTREASYVKILLEGNKVIVESEGDTGSFSEWSRVKYEGDPCHFYISPQFLSSVLDIGGDVFVSERSLLFENDNFSHVVSLLQGK